MKNPTIDSVNQIIKSIESTKFDKDKKIYQLNMLGDLHMIKEDLSNAEKLFKSAEKINPSDIQTKLNLAKIYTKICQKHLAGKYYKQCLKLLSSSTEFSKTDLALVVFLNYAIFLIEPPQKPEHNISDLVNAKTIYDKVQICERSIKFRKDNFCDDINQEDKDLALSLINQALEIDPNYPKALIMKTLFTLNKDEQMHLYLKAIDNDINRSPLSHYMIATILISKDYDKPDYEKANTYYKLAVELDKSMVDKRISYFIELSMRGKFAEGRQIINEILKDHPDNKKAQDIFKLFNLDVYPILDDSFL